MEAKMFREVIAIDLYEPQVTIGQHNQGVFDYDDGFAGLEIDVGVILDLAQMFDLDVNRPSCGLLAEGVNIRRRSFVCMSPGEMKIKQIFARVDGPQLLQIRVVYGYDDGDETKEIEEFTYCGKFTVRWKVSA